jgi:hypothetical protein
MPCFVHNFSVKLTCASTAPGLGACLSTFGHPWSAIWQHLHMFTAGVHVGQQQEQGLSGRAQDVSTCYQGSMCTSDVDLTPAKRLPNAFVYQADPLQVVQFSLCAAVPVCMGSCQ